MKRLAAGGEIPCHFTTLTTAIYHWQDLAACLETYENAVLVRRHGRRDPLEPAERNLDPHRRRVLRYPGVVAWFTGYKMELFYKYVLQYEDGTGNLRVGCRRHHAFALHQLWITNAACGSHSTRDGIPQ